ncbi:hypothetical protein NHX12_009941 [Muraenolepis orangiensis]|uniref:Synaptotagmin-like mitochondrial and lipid-binding domain-containing protein n=1 Tax=Muraenolepis orangiensis TaxID=630683 RepID=A0A9Q0I8U8_9TELE|nr:hypothetical protein NHX12_009941 [Muraenolepis orangiensis]
MKPDQDAGWCWWCLVGLFLLSLCIVFAWLVQYSLATVRVWRAKKRAKRDPGGSGAARRHLPPDQDRRTHTGGWRGFLHWLRPGRDGRAAPSEAGAKGLLATLFSFKSFGEPWQKAWVKALNDQACRHGSSIQITFDGTLPPTASMAVERVTCTDQSARSMVLHCDCRLESVVFPVTVTQQSHAAVSMDTYQVTIEPAVAKLVACLEEVKEGGLLVSWSLSRQPSLALRVSPRRPHQQGAEGGADLNTIKELVEDTLFSTQPSVLLNLSSSQSSATCVPVDRLTLRQLRATCHKGQWTRPAELCCVVSLDQSSTERRTGFVCVPSSPVCSLGWSEDITLLLEQNGARERFLPGQASIALDVGGKVPTGPLTVSVSPGHGLAPNVTVTLEGSSGGHSPMPPRTSLTPPNTVDVGRTVMADGTIVTTVTTVQSRPKGNPGESPSPSPYKGKEKGPMVLFDDRGRNSPAPSLSSHVPNGLDPVAETAIRQLTDGRVSGKTPTKRSTLIISGVSKAPLQEDDHALSAGYAAAMDAAAQANNHQGAGPCQDPDQRTPSSDMSERPSVDDLESDTGSNGAMETRSLKEHKAGFLRSGSKLLFRRKRRNKDPAVSQSHEDLSQAGESPGPTASPSTSSTLTRKSSGSFSRRLIKRFSFRSSSGKSKSSAANGGAGAPGN